MIATPYPPGEGPVFRCGRQGAGGLSCDWLGFPAESGRCPLHPDHGRHRYEPLNFNPLSFQPLWNYASACGFWLYPADFMAMGCRARYIDGAEVVLFATRTANRATTSTSTTTATQPGQREFTRNPSRPRAPSSTRPGWTTVTATAVSTAPAS